MKGPSTKAAKLQDNMVSAYHSVKGITCQEKLASLVFVVGAVLAGEAEEHEWSFKRMRDTFMAALVELNVEVDKHE